MYAKYAREAHRTTKIRFAKASTLRRPISVGSTSCRYIEPCWLSAIRPEKEEGARLNIELPDCQGRGRTTESRQGSTLRHDVEPTKIGRRRVLALTNLILVVRCASHLLLSVLFAYIRQRVRGEQHILRGEAKIVLTLTLTLFLALKATAHTTHTKIMCCVIACNIAFDACNCKPEKTLLDMTV